MEEIASTLHESCSAAVLDGDEVVYVARVQAKRIMSINLVVGSRLPAHATSMGKVLLAHLSPEALDRYLASANLRALTPQTITRPADLRRVLLEVRQRGWAFSDQESEMGVRTVAVPLFNHANQIDSALNVSAHASRVSMRELKRRYLPVLQDGARRISRALGATFVLDGPRGVVTKPARRDVQNFRRLPAAYR
jgi:IclR family pca regulon transcriptional regulator